MVKKIRLIEDNVPDEDPITEDQRAQLFELAQSIDWKLWELLKIGQAWAEREGLNTHDDPKPEIKITPPKPPGVKSIIVDEDK
jgi:hypothetical protein